MDIEGKPPCDQQAIADPFYNYFFLQLTKLPSIIHIIRLGPTKILFPLLPIFYHKLKKNSFPVTGLTSVSTTEIINIIKYLK